MNVSDRDAEFNVNCQPWHISMQLSNNNVATEAIYNPIMYDELKITGKEQIVGIYKYGLYLCVRSEENQVKTTNKTLVLSAEIRMTTFT
jgi:hypothetical protein